MIVDVVVVAVVVPSFALIPGTLLGASMPFSTAEQRTAAAGGWGLALLALVAFMAHLAGSSSGAMTAVVWVAAVIAGAAWLARTRRPYRRSLSWPLFGLWALFYVALLGFQGMTPIYAGGNWYGDWWEHYSISQAWLRSEGAYALRWFDHDTLASRTPLFNLGAAFALSLTGDAFWTYQVFATFANSLFLLSMYLVVDELLGRRTALLAVLFVFFNTWLVHDAMFTWAKMTMTYFILLSLHLYLAFRRHGEPARLYLSACVGGLAVMTHQGAASYVAALAIDYVWLHPRARRSWRQAALAAAIFAAVVVPWHLWIHSIYGLDHMVTVVPAMSMGAWSLAPQLRGILENTVTSIVPLPLLDYLRHGNFVRDRILFRLVEFYFNPLAGALTASLIAVVVCTTPLRPSRSFVEGFYRLKGPLLCLGFGGSMLALLVLTRGAFDLRFGSGPFVWSLAVGLAASGLWSWLRRPRTVSTSDPADVVAVSPHLTATLFGLVGYWGGLLIHPGGEREGIASNALMPSVIIVIAYAMGRVAKLRTWTLAAFFAGVVVEFAVTWFFLGSLIADGPPFRYDGNHSLKLEHHLTLLYDWVGGRWAPFAILVLGAQAAAAATVARRLAGLPHAEGGQGLALSPAQRSARSAMRDAS